MKIAELQRLAGITPVKETEHLEGSNISVTGTEKRRIEREQNIQPGTDAWFKLWFSRPYWIGWPAEFRGRAKRK